VGGCFAVNILRRTSGGAENPAPESHNLVCTAVAEDCLPFGRAVSALLVVLFFKSMAALSHMFLLPEKDVGDESDDPLGLPTANSFGHNRLRTEQRSTRGTLSIELAAAVSLEPSGLSAEGGRRQQSAAVEISTLMRRRVEEAGDFSARTGGDLAVELLWCAFERAARWMVFGCSTYEWSWFKTSFDSSAESKVIAGGRDIHESRPEGCPAATVTENMFDARIFTTACYRQKYKQANKTGNMLIVWHCKSLHFHSSTFNSPVSTLNTSAWRLEN
jgi:hypothetical protein